MHDATAIAKTLRAARKAHGLSLAALAARSGVSPRLIGEFERGQRPNVSLETALRLLALVNVRLSVHGMPAPSEARVDREARAMRRSRTWIGVKGTVVDQDVPPAPSPHAHRLQGVASASRLAVGLKAARRVRG